MAFIVFQNHNSYYDIENRISRFSPSHKKFLSISISIDDIQMPSRHRGTYVLQFCLIDVNYNDPKKETKRTSYLIQKKKKD